jgi:aldehyde dehydrogenase (NAD+)
MTPLSTREEARAAVEAAERAFGGWRDTPAPARGDIMYRVARTMAARKEELAKILTREEGKILSESLGEIQRSINIAEFTAGEARRLRGETVPSEMPHTFCYTVKQPLGVVALITPWNFPAAIPVWKVFPALVAGNTAVLKPATSTPLMAIKMVEIFQECGLPKGVLNMVIGSGSEVGDEILSHPAVRAVSFTGSNEVGSKIYEGGARRGIKVQCEMGGKNPIVVLRDANLEMAVEGAVQGAFGSTGQRCTATSRAVVEEPVADAFVEGVIERARSMKVGSGLDPTVKMGPAVDESQMEKILGYIEVGKKEGAKLVVGGHRLQGGAYDKGYFVAPTVFDHVSPRMVIAQEEIFGPVLSVIRAKNFDQAVEAANSVRFGLSASLYSNDSAKIFRFIDKAEVGIVRINSPTVGGEAHLPFGGMKATGVGTREQGSVVMDFYTELKVVYVDYKK